MNGRLDEFWLDSFQCGPEWLRTCALCGAMVHSSKTSMHLEWHETLRRIDNYAVAIDAISARLCDVQQHPALSIPPLPGFE